MRRENFLGSNVAHSGMLVYDGKNTEQFVFFIIFRLMMTMTDVFSRVSPVDTRYTSLSEEIRQILLEAFIDGELIPGTRINDMELAKRLGVSRTPVREALRGLQTMGIIETLPARITRVVKLSKDEFDHVQMVWASLLQLLLAD